jgi:hypothetical protein
MGALPDQSHLVATLGVMTCLVIQSIESTANSTKLDHPWGGNTLICPDSSCGTHEKFLDRFKHTVTTLAAQKVSGKSGFVKISRWATFTSYAEDRAAASSDPPGLENQQNPREVCSHRWVVTNPANWGSVLDYCRRRPRSEI